MIIVEVLLRKEELKGQTLDIHYFLVICMKKLKFNAEIVLLFYALNHYSAKYSNL